MITPAKALIIIFVIAIVTYAIRVIPFILFPDNKKRPEYVLYLGEVLPLAIMGMLVVYCLKGVSLVTYPNGIPEAIAIGVVLILHLWKKNFLISICGATALYIVLVQFIFV